MRGASVTLGPNTNANQLKHASGLTCNMSKCQMAPIRCQQEQIDLATSLFPCTCSDFPLKYLGIPLSVNELPKAALQPLLDQVADHLPTWKGQLMNRSGRLTLIKTTISAIPIYVSIAIKLPPWFINGLIKFMKGFLWTGADVVKGGKVPHSMGFGSKTVGARWPWNPGSKPSRPGTKNKVALAVPN